MRMRICLTGLVLFFYMSIGSVTANDWTQYDVKWKSHNPEKRLEVLTRAVMHYQSAHEAYAQKKINVSKTRALDAVKVIPSFSEAYFLLAMIENLQQRSASAKHWRQKGEEYADAVSVLDEYEYLSFNIDRLKDSYKPGNFVLNRIVFYLIAIFGFSLFVFVIFILGIPHFAGMVFLHLFRKQQTDDEEEHLRALMTDEDINGKNKNAGYVVLFKLTACAVPFFVIYLLVNLFGFQSLMLKIGLSLFLGLAAFFLLAVLLFDDTK